MVTNRREVMLGGALAAAISLPGKAQIIETARERVVTNLEVPLPYVGTLRARSVSEIEASNWLLGCETLDRGYADWDQYKEFIAPLGIKRLRMQAGWARTERFPGSYDFSWLDHIIDDATARGFRPWLQTSYGNPIYPGAGGENLGAGLPKSTEALLAWDRWIEATVCRYGERVRDWEVWNEPNFGDNTINTPEAVADFNVRTARIIKRHQPHARISGLALGHYEPQFVDRFFSRLAARQGFPLFDNMTYHDYCYNPDANVHEVASLRASLDRHAPMIRLRQGENGAPSAGGAGRGALWDYPWTELTQAKWNTRRMLGNLGQDIECSIFGLAEMSYSSGPISKLNYKGLLKSDGAKRIIRPKSAYYAVQNVTSIFDNRLERIRTLRHSHDAENRSGDETCYSMTTDRRFAMNGYSSKVNGRHLYATWLTEDIPTDDNELRLQTITITGAVVDDPVWIDIVSGAVHTVPASQQRRQNGRLHLKGIPIYDAPVVIADRSLVPLSV